MFIQSFFYNHLEGCQYFWKLLDILNYYIITVTIVIIVTVKIVIKLITYAISDTLFYFIIALFKHRNFSFAIYFSTFKIFGTL